MIVKANEFVKRYGWSSLKIAIRLPQFKRYKYVIFYSDEIDFKNEFDEYHKDYMFETSEIKQLIEAKELVDSFGGLDGAKKYLRTRDVWVTAASNSRLICAIQLVESCQC